MLLLLLSLLLFVVVFVVPLLPVVFVVKRAKYLINTMFDSSFFPRLRSCFGYFTPS